MVCLKFMILFLCLSIFSSLVVVFCGEEKCLISFIVVLLVLLCSGLCSELMVLVM